MAALSRRHTRRYQLTNPNALLLRYKKIFVYYYRYGHFWQPEKFPNHNLKQIGCKYQGWFHVGGDSMGEIWKYPSHRHKILIQMSLDSRNLIWHEQWARKVKRQKRLREEENAYMTKMIKKMLRGQHSQIP